MTNGEYQAIAIADKYYSKVTDHQQIKHLATEVVELQQAISNKDEKNIEEEIGDCLYILLHILSRHNPHKKSMTTLALNASDKLEMRKYAELKNS